MQAGACITANPTERDPMTTVTDTDTEQQVQRLYRARGTPEFVDVPELRFLMIDGHGDPNHSERYQQAVQALYAVSYTLKFALKKQHGLEWRVAPLEGLWWAQDMDQFSIQRKADWDWTMMIRQPAEVTLQLVEQAVRQVAQAKRLPAAWDVRLERFTEGPAAPRCCTWGPTAPKAPPSPRCTRSSTITGAALTADATSTTRSTWATRDAARRSG